jgi:hypothetical protein
VKFKVTMTVTQTYEVDPKLYGEPPLSAQEMLDIDLTNAEEDPEMFISDDRVEIKVVGEVVEE